MTIPSTTPTRRQTVSSSVRCCGLALPLHFMAGAVAAQPAAVLPTEPSALEDERRNAASAFVFARRANLDMLRFECGTMLVPPMSHAESTALNWNQRNAADIAAALVWTDRYLRRQKEADPVRYERASLELVTAYATAMSDSARTHFERGVPTQELCERALRLYELPQLDIKNLATEVPSVREFPETLQRIRNEPGYLVAPNLNLSLQETSVRNAVASLDAANAAVQRGDGATAVEVYRRLATHGDARSAQTLGLLYWEGRLVERQERTAFHWFYMAFGLGDYDGLNAMAVALRDGRGVEANAEIASAAFHLVLAGARRGLVYERAKRNVERLEVQLSRSQLDAVSCMTIEEVFHALHRALPAFAQESEVRAVGGERRVGKVTGRGLPAGGCS